MPKHSLFRLASKIYNVPHLITPSAFNVVLDYLDARNSGLTLMMPAESDTNATEETSNMDNGLAVINVDGSLTYQPVMTMCGEVGTSYQSLAEQVEDVIECGCKTIVMNITSGGGEASHVFQCAQDIREMCDAANVKLISYADTYMCSAAYALGVISDIVIANPSATVGSIGCVVCLLDTSKAMEQAGLKRIFITSGEAKVPYDDTGAFKQDFLDSIQKDVNDLNTEFADFVSKYSGIDAKLVRGFDAASFNAQEALDKGLVNGIMTNKQFAAYVADIHQGATYA